MKPEPVPGLKGLILCGGRSSRMRADKSQLNYHAIPQWEYVRQLLRDRVSETWISCRKEQAAQFGETAGLLFDEENTAGPAAGMLAAHARFPAAAWLVVACDLPLVSPASIAALLEGRDPERPATAFLNPEMNWPEPLLAIWEPAGLHVLRENAARGLHCPRKTLLQCDPALRDLPDPEALFNANTPEEKALAEKLLKQAETAGLRERPADAAPHPRKTPFSG